MRFGFDIHGVLDDLPETFKVLNNTLYDAGHEIHVITGSHITDDIKKQLSDIGIKYHVLFSISDYHESIGTDMWYDNHGTPWMNEFLWDKTKGEYCEKVGIDLHFDDSDNYNNYFTTPYARVWSNKNKKCL